MPAKCYNFDRCRTHTAFCHRAIKIAMPTRKILPGLLLCAAIWHPQYALAASFCATSPEGKILVDKCNYGSYDECKHAAGKRGDCVVNQEKKPAPEKMGPYCVVVMSTDCSYNDYATCNKAANEQMGYCYLNPDYKNPDK